ncbi:MAG: hypothetical protein J6R29_06535, partial [Clostridia bacterium]|nr:hypothetical protein [Clostridia bacterium]
MKCKILKTLIISLILSLFAGLFSINFNTVYADSQNELNTKFYLPSSPIEFYDLTSPVALTYSNGNYAFSEYYDDKENNKNDVNSLVVYNSATKSYTKVTDSTSIQNISCIALYENFLFYVSGSKIYYADITDLSKAPVNTGVYASNYISVNGNTIIANTNNSIEIYDLSFENETLYLKHLYSISDES